MTSLSAQHCAWRERERAFLSCRHKEARGNLEPNTNHGKSLLSPVPAKGKPLTKQEKGCHARPASAQHACSVRAERAVLKGRS